ncbi:hypothetical protein DRR52_19555 [Escherichia coli]|nr:hypothetical protein [Escherichia coli]MHX46710.1 hypothetical protein [Escherichia coli]RIB94477.1 hypothetical protein D1887_20060 [Escherichia coli]TFA71394.1 hypothetical protein BON96_10065 [Escherichia coli]
MGIRTLWATKGSWSRELVLFNLILMRANHSVGADIPFAHYGHKEQIMKNDKLTNEQQAQNKSNLKKRAGYAWELFKWGIRLFDLITRALDYLEGGGE